MSSFLEIIQLPNGDIVLQRIGGQGEPLINIRFSEQSKAYFNDSPLTVARTMIEAGVNALAPVIADTSITDEDEEGNEPVLH